MLPCSEQVTYGNNLNGAMGRACQRACVRVCVRACASTEQFIDTIAITGPTLPVNQVL